MADYLYDGTVSADSTLSVREGPGDVYPVKQGLVYKPGEKVQIQYLQKSGTVTWGSLKNGGWIKVSQGSKTYVRYGYANKEDQERFEASQKKNSDGSTSASAYYEPSLYNSTSSTSKSTSKYNVGDTVDASKTIPKGTTVNMTGQLKVSNATMRLFGLPYQFNPACDIRYEKMSPVVGREFANKFFVDGPILYMIPGRAKYTESYKDNGISGHALISATNGDLGPLKVLLDDARKQPLMFYDFQEDYSSYMKYVNMMCRTVAGFLQLKEKIADGSSTIDFQTYDWKNYRWTSSKYKSTVNIAVDNLVKSAKAKLNSLISTGNADATQALTAGSGALEILINDGDDSGITNLNSLGSNNKYVMFYVDPSTTCNESYSNETSESDLQQKIDSLSATSRDYAFYASSAGAEGALDAVGDAAASWFGDGVMNMGGPISNVLNKIISVGSSVVKGENIILPEIYQKSNYSKDYQVMIHLKTPYGDKLSVYMDVIVPMLHILAFTLPKQATPNTYGSPFLIKAYVPGVFNCSLGIVTALQIDKARTEDAWSVDGLPMEVDITMTIKDLYTRLSMSPSNEPLMFLNNSCLIDYLANVAGLNLILPQAETKVKMMINTTVSAIKDIKGNIGSFMTDDIDRLFNSFVTL